MALRLIRAAAPPAAEAPALVGPDWVAEEIGGQGVLDGLAPSLIFTAEGMVAGSGGCNRLAGGYSLSGEGIAFTRMAATRMACVPAVAEQEGRFLRALGEARRWRITPEGRLLLLDAAGVALGRLARP